MGQRGRLKGRSKNLCSLHAREDAGSSPGRCFTGCGNKDVSFTIGMKNMMLDSGQFQPVQHLVYVQPSAADDGQITDASAVQCALLPAWGSASG